jgi:hypothetical protein
LNTSSIKKIITTSAANPPPNAIKASELRDEVVLGVGEGETVGAWVGCYVGVAVGLDVGVAVGLGVETGA